MPTDVSYSYYYYSSHHNCFLILLLVLQVFHAVALPLPLLMRTLSSKVHKDDFERSTMRFALQLTFCYSIKVGQLCMPCKQCGNVMVHA